MNPDRLYRMALAARICRKIRGYRSDGSGGPEQVYGVGVRPHSKAAGIHMVFGKAKGGQMVFGKATGIHMAFPFMSGSRIYAYLRCSRCLGSSIYAYLRCSRCLGSRIYAYMQCSRCLGSSIHMVFGKATGIHMVFVNN